MTRLLNNNDETSELEVYFVRIAEPVLGIDLAEYDREVEFARDRRRRWRFDFARRDLMLAIELEGLRRDGQTRHQLLAGFAEDCRKYNTAAVLGWTVIRITRDDLRTEAGRQQIVDWINDAIDRHLKQQTDTDRT